MPHMPHNTFSGRSSSTDNGYASRIQKITNDWFLAETLYNPTLKPGNVPVIGEYSVVMEGALSTLGGMTGSGRDGVVLQNTGDTADGRCRLQTVAAGAFDGTTIESLAFEWVGAVSALSTSSDPYRVEIGHTGNAYLSSPRPGWACHFRYQHTVGGHKWMAVNRDNDVETLVVLDGSTQGGIATEDPGSLDALSLPDYGFFRLKVIAVANADGTGAYANYYVASAATDYESVLCAQIASHMPTHSLAGSVDMQKLGGTTGRYLATDFTEWTRVRSGPRLP